LPEPTLALDLDFAPVWQSFGVLLRGFGIALLVAVAAIAVAIVVGLVVALARLSPVPPLRWLAFAYTQLFRGIALYVLIIWVYFGLAAAADVNFNPIPAGITTLALLNSAYLSETFRAGILAVDRGQREAALAMGLSRWQAFRDVVAPQALRVVVPATGNQFVDAIKDSAILSVIGVPDLMRETQRLAQFYFRPFEFYTIAGAMYLAAVFAVSYAVRRLERHLGRTAITPRARLFAWPFARRAAEVGAQTQTSRTS
jgi:His/Glu/Gln/Arg/opine family amino acid ABC transporter permease subunit